MSRQAILKRFLPFISVLLTGSLYYFSTGLTGFRPLVLIAPVPVLLMAMRSTRRSTSVLAFCASVLGGLNLVGYMARLAPMGVVIGSLLIPAIAFALVVVAFRDAIVHLKHPLSFLAFPIGWTAYEFLLSSVSPHGSAGSIAYTQTDVLPMIQLASITGVQGITFVVTLIPAGIAAAILSRDRTSFLFVFLTVLTLGFGTLAYGWIRLAEPYTGPSLRVGLVAIDSTVGRFNTADSEQALGVLKTYGSSIANLAGRGAQIVVLPEKIACITEQYEHDVYDLLSDIARREHVALVAGLNRVGAEPHRNLAVIISSDGSVLGTYDKVYPVPGLESGYRTGQHILLLRMFDISAGFAICKDMDFQNWIRQYGESGAGILFVPAWDFSTDAWLHSRMAVLRAAENGFALVRSANNGYLTVTDEKGRVLGEAASSRNAATLLLVDVHPGADRTLYARAGNWFAWVNVFFLLILVVAVSRRLARRFVTNNS